MFKQWSFQIFAGLLFVSLFAGQANAHGGHKKPTAAPLEPAYDSPYAIDEAESSPDAKNDLSLSRSDVFADESPVAPAAMEHQSGEMNHTMPQVEIAKREWVSSKQKGYGTAVGITLIAGLIFGVLSFKRPLE